MLVVLVEQLEQLADQEVLVLLELTMLVLEELEDHVVKADKVVLEELEVHLVTLVELVELAQAETLVLQETVEQTETTLMVLVDRQDLEVALDLAVVLEVHPVITFIIVDQLHLITAVQSLDNNYEI
jgi:hypothetical protein